jgi:hypothetical protein
MGAHETVKLDFICIFDLIPINFLAALADVLRNRNLSLKGRFHVFAAHPS